MNPYSRFIGRAAAVAALLVTIALPTFAQAPKPDGAVPFTLPSGFSLPPGIFSGILGQFGVPDPSHSNALPLLMRNDVRTELLITAQQREKIADLQDKSRQDMRDRMRTVAMQSFQDIQNTPQDQIAEKVKQGLEQVQTALQTYQGELDKKTEAILTPRQISRLHELDLQWRGPLAFSDPKVAQSLNLTAEQKTKATAAMQEYMDVVQKALMAVFGNFQKSISGAGDGNAPPAPPNPLEMQKRMADAVQGDAAAKSRKTAETKALATLTADQRQSWTTRQGKKFTFRVVDN
jgi:hypothetical protein